LHRRPGAIQAGVFLFAGYSETLVEAVAAGASLTGMGRHLTSTGTNRDQPNANEFLTIKLRRRKPTTKALPEMVEFVRGLSGSNSLREIETLQWSNGDDVTLHEFADWMIRGR